MMSANDDCPRRILELLDTLWHRKRRAAGTARLFSFLCSHHRFSAGDYFMRRFLILGSAALATLASSIGGADAQQVQRVQVGVLECRGGASVGFIVGSVTNLGCVLRAEGMPEDRYIATIRKVGLDLGITQESALAWGVFAPVARLGPGALLRRLCRRAGQRDRSASASAAMCWSAAPPIRSRCSP
jgi:hypothetical protein